MHMIYLRKNINLHTKNIFMRYIYDIAIKQKKSKLTNSGTGGIPFTPLRKFIIKCFC